MFNYETLISLLTSIMIELRSYKVLLPFPHLQHRYMSNIEAYCDAGSTVSFSYEGLFLQSYMLSLAKTLFELYFLLLSKFNYVKIIMASQLIKKPLVSMFSFVLKSCCLIYSTPCN